MASILINSAVNFGFNANNFDEFDFSGIIELGVSPTLVQITYDDGSIDQFFGFGFQTDGMTVTAGTVTGFAGFLPGGIQRSSITELNLSAVTIAGLIEVNDGFGVRDLGLAGDDQILSGGGDDILLGGPGDDVIDGGAGSDTLDGGTGFDAASYVSSSGPVAADLSLGFAIDGSGGFDTFISIEDLFGSSHNDLLIGDDQFNFLFGSAGDDDLRGGDASDFLNGQADDDSLSGDAGNDTLNGGPGDDILDGGVGDDSLNGDLGNDTFIVDSPGDQIVDAGGVDSVQASFNFVLANGLENLTLMMGAGDIDGDGNGAANVIVGNNGANLLRGEGGDDELRGEAGNDTLEGGAGADALMGGDGTDVAFYGDSAARVIVNLKTGFRSGGEAAGDTYDSVEGLEGSAFNDILVGSDGANILMGRAGVDTLRGEEGDDLLEGGAGSDVLYGDEGMDIASYAASAARVVVNLGSGFRSGGDAAGDTYGGIEGLAGSAFNDILVGTAGANTLLGGGGVDTLRGEDGDDMLEGGAGFDKLIGGPGLDIASYAASGARVVINLGSGFRTGGDASGDSFDSIEGLAGSDFNDVLVGTDAANLLLGGDGRDTLRGENGDDTLEGGAGFDALVGGAGTDIASYAGSAARVVVNLASGFRSGGDAAGDSFSGIEGLAGSAFNDVLVGTGGANILLGGAGRDTLRGDGGDDRLEGGAGFDVLVGGGGTDIASYAASAARVVINLGTGFRTGGDAAGDSYDGIEGLEGSAFNDVLVGTATANSLLGRDGRDTLRGEGGDDILEGGPGFDALNGGAGVDIASYAGSAARVVINLGTGFRSGGDASGDSYSGIEGLEGSAFNDILVGTNGADVLMGGDGADQLRGLGGDDMLDGGAGDDVLTGGPGADALVGGADMDIASYAGSAARVVVNLGSGFRSGGDAAGDTYSGVEGLEGSAFNDILVGTSGANTLMGAAGDDLLRGAAGDDMLTGGGGSDTFDIELGSDIDTIIDFDVGVDVIDISAYGFANFNAVLAATTDVGGRAQIALNGAQDVLRLNGVLEAQLLASDFLL